MSANPTIVFPAPRKVEIVHQAMPAPKERELLLKTKYSMISTGTELSVLEAEYEKGSKWEEWTKFPCYPGYCNVAEVVGVGEKVEKTWMGKKVAAPGPHSGYFTWSVDAPVNLKANIVQRDVADRDCVFQTLASIAMNSIRKAKLEWGQAVVVYGQGLIGQLTAQFCRINGARPVIAVDISDERLARLPADPAIIRVNAKKEDVAAMVKQVTKGRMADVVFEVTGLGSLIPQEFSLLKKQGKFIVLSAPRGSTKFDFHDLCCVPSITIIGTHNSSHPSAETSDNPWSAERDAELFFDLLADGEVHVGNLVSHCESYQKAPELYAMLMKDKSAAMGVVLEW